MEMAVAFLSASATVKLPLSSESSVSCTAAVTVKESRSSPTISLAPAVMTTQPSWRIEIPLSSGSTRHSTVAPTGSSAPSVTVATKGTLTKSSSLTPGTVKSVVSGAVIAIRAGAASAKEAVTLWSAMMPPIA